MPRIVITLPADLARRTCETGLAAVASIAAYAENHPQARITTPAKEDDRVRQIEAVNAQTGPVMLAYPARPRSTPCWRGPPPVTAAVDVTADDGVRHQLWVIDDATTIAALTRAVDALPALYIADGHHRSARHVARRQGARWRRLAHRYFLAVLFPQAR
jgi:uncharacterized protein (DUF1015 family)